MGDAVLMTALDALRAAPRAWLTTRLIEARVLARSDPYVPFEFEGPRGGGAPAPAARLLEALAGACAVLEESYLPDMDVLREALLARLPTHLLDAELELGAAGGHDLAWDDDAGRARAAGAAAPVATPAAHPLLRRVAVVQSDATHLAVALPLALHPTRADGGPPVRVELTLLAVRLRAGGGGAGGGGAVARLPLHPVAGAAVTTLTLGAWCAHHARAGDFHRAGAFFVASVLLDGDEGRDADARLRALDRLLLGRAAAACGDGAADATPAAGDAALAEVHAAIRRLPRRAHATGATRVAARTLRPVHFPVPAYAAQPVERAHGGYLHVRRPLDGRRAWAVVHEGRTLATPRRAACHDFARAARATLDAFLASHALAAQPIHAVTYVTADSLSDVFY